MPENHLKISEQDRILTKVGISLKNTANNLFFLAQLLEHLPFYYGKVRRQIFLTRVTNSVASRC